MKSRAESELVSGNYTSKAFDGGAFCTVVGKSVYLFPYLGMTFENDFDYLKMSLLYCHNIRNL